MVSYKNILLLLRNQPAAAVALLKGGADGNKLNKNKCSPLHVAVNKGYTDVVKTLLNFSCDVNAQVCYNSTHLPTQDLSSSRSEMELEEERVKGGKLNVKFFCFVLQDTYGDTVLHDAIAKDFIEIVDVLVNFRGVDLSIKNKRGFNCLHHAALKGNARSVAISEREKGEVGEGGGGWGLKKGRRGWRIDCLLLTVFIQCNNNNNKTFLG